MWDSGCEESVRHVQARQQSLPDRERMKGERARTAETDMRIENYIPQRFSHLLLYTSGTSVQCRRGARSTALFYACAECAYVCVFTLQLRHYHCSRLGIHAQKCFQIPVSTPLLGRLVCAEIDLVLST